MKFSLKLKIMIAFIAFIGLSMGTLGAVTYYKTSQALQEATNSQLKQRADDASQLIQKSIDSVQADVEIASLNSQIIDLIKDPKSEEKIDTAFNYITSVQKSNKDFMEVLIITDPVGKVIIDTQTKTPDIDLGDREYMLNTLGSGKTSISQVLTSRFTQNPAIFISVPVKENDTIVGTLVGSIRFASISDYVSDITIGEDGYGYMVDRDGLIVAHTNDAKVLKENICDSSDEDLKKLAGDMKEMKTGDGFYTYNDMRKYVTYTPVDDKWCIAITAGYDEYMSTAISMKKNTIILCTIAVIISILCSYLYSTKCIINPIKYLENLMKRAGEGNLEVRAEIKLNDEIGELGKSFNSMMESQNEIVKNVIIASKQLDEASEHLASSAEEISATTQEVSATVDNVSEDSKRQNKSVADISALLSQLADLVNTAQSRAESTDENARISKDEANKGRLRVEDTVQAMNSIRVESSETARVLKIVNELSHKVGGVVNTINEIAEQTNLLALNAAIEAARAGEEGRGFSVVAEEVRQLAEETNGKSKEITSFVSKMIEETEHAVSAMERANEKVQNGVEVVDETDKAFIKIIESIENIVSHVGEILDITRNEVTSSDKVVSLINEIAAGTENNSVNCEAVAEACSEEADAINNLTSTAEETSSMAQELMTLVEKFKV